LENFEKIYKRKGSVINLLRIWKKLTKMRMVPAWGGVVLLQLLAD